MLESIDPTPETSVGITLTTEFTRAGLLSLRRRVDSLLELWPEESQGETAPDRRDRAVSKVERCWDRLGATSRAYLAACARVAQRHPDFTVELVAREMGEAQHTKVLAYHRNVMRTSSKAEPTDIELIQSRRSGNETRLRMTEDVVAAVLDIARQGH